MRALPSLLSRVALLVLALIPVTVAPDPPQLPAGCSYEYVGCYEDYDNSGRYPKYEGPRDLPNDAPGCGMEGKKVVPPEVPICTGVAMTQEYCSRACWAWKKYPWSGTQTGDECWCAMGLSNKAKGVGAKPPAECNKACKGVSGALTPDNACGGFWRISVGQLKGSCVPGGEAGWDFLGVAVFAFSAYCVFGVAYNVHVKKAALGGESMPNKELWAKLPGLVQDGVRFSLSKLGGGGGEAYERVAKDQGSAAPAPRASGGGGGGGGGGERYRQGQTVEYQSSGGWIAATVVRDSGGRALDLDKKKGARREKVRKRREAQRSGLDARDHATLHS